jgi:hypothetical protein
MDDVAPSISSEWQVLWWVLLFLALWWGLTMLIRRYGLPFQKKRSAHRHRKHHRHSDQAQTPDPQAKPPVS